ncbi:MAG TPA: transcriptional regulator [Paracoccaceae bacterium]
MLTSAQMRAARALLGIDQKTLAGLADVSVPTIQRMESSPGNVRGWVDSLTKVVDALNAAGIELIADGAVSGPAGYGVRLKSSTAKDPAPPGATAEGDPGHGRN